MTSNVATFTKAFFPSGQAEAIDEWQVVEKSDVDPRIRLSADKQLMERAIQQFRAGQTVPPYNLDHSLGSVQRAI
jgi:hypothetical protein